MFLNFGILVNAVLLVLGTLWCREMFGRWHKDIEQYRTAKDASTRQALIIVWGITALIVVFLLNSLGGILINLGVL